MKTKIFPIGIIAVLLTLGAVAHFCKEKPFVVLCDGHGSYAITDWDGDLWPSSGHPDRFSSYDEAAKEAAWLKQWSADYEAGKKTKWHECK